MIDAIGIERRRPTDDPMDLVALLQQKFGQIGTVLADDARDECAVHVILRRRVGAVSLILPACGSLTAWTLTRRRRRE